MESIVSDLNIRQPSVAGLFYSEEPKQLLTEVHSLLLNARASHAIPKIIVVPHAGYKYSGQIAANAFSALTKLQGIVERVVLMGPCHRYPVKGIAAPSADIFVTPLNHSPVDKQALTQILNCDGVAVIEKAFDNEHCLEVQLPFIQYLLGKIKILPLLVGQTTTSQVEQVFEQLWGGQETLFVVSSDLSHYLDYDEAQKLDHGTAQSIIDFNGEVLDGKHACGIYALRGALAAAKKHSLSPQLVSLGNSGDTAGTKDRVVGYGAFYFNQHYPYSLSTEQSQQLLMLAKQSIQHGLDTGQPLAISDKDITPIFSHSAATFVTIEMNGQLRGCCGNLIACMPMMLSIAKNAFRSAFNDQRFKPLTAAELPHLKIKISLLSPLQRLYVSDEQQLLDYLTLHKPGLILREGAHQATFLPVVWQQLPDAHSFLTHLKRKAGFDVKHWSKDMIFLRYDSQYLEPV